MTKFDVHAVRKLFPILAAANKQKPLIYFDNAATSQKPLAVIQATNEYYQEHNANVHRAAHYLSAISTRNFETARETIQKFINAKSNKEIIWTSGATESINLVAQCWAKHNLSLGDEIVLSQAEHHANIVPWQQIAKQTGAVLKVLPLTECGRIDLASEVITEKTKLVSVHHVSNVIGKFNNLKSLIHKAKSVGALTLIDGAQALAHSLVDVQELDCDFYVFSAHKMYGPTGVGVLYAKQHLLEQMPPYKFGGEMIKAVSFNSTQFNELPFKFEAGTPNIAGVVAFEKAVNLLQTWHSSKDVIEYETSLTRYLFQELQSIDGVSFPFRDCPDIPLISFSLENVHHFDVATMFDSHGIAVRSGHHCAMPLMQYLNCDGLIRISLAPYNTFSEIDCLLEVLKQFLKNESNQVNQNPNCKMANYELNNNEQVLYSLLNTKGWDNKYRQIMLLAADLPAFPSNEQTPENLITGCESNAWLIAYYNETNNVLSFALSSQARIIRGLMVIILACYNNKTPEDILTFDIDKTFSDLGLLQHLSPSRGNGILAIVNKIRAIAKTHLNV